MLMLLVLIVDVVDADVVDFAVDDDVDVGVVDGDVDVVGADVDVGDVVDVVAE